MQLTMIWFLKKMLLQLSLVLPQKTGWFIIILRNCLVLPFQLSHISLVTSHIHGRHCVAHMSHTKLVIPIPSTFPNTRNFTQFESEFGATSSTLKVVQPTYLPMRIPLLWRQCIHTETSHPVFPCQSFIQEEHYQLSLCNCVQGVCNLQWISISVVSLPAGVSGKQVENNWSHPNQNKRPSHCPLTAEAVGRAAGVENKTRDLSVYQASWIVRLWSLRFSHKGNWA